MPASGEVPKMVEIYNDDRTEKRVANTNPALSRDVTAQLN